MALAFSITEFTSKLKARSVIVSYPPDQSLGYRDLAHLVRSRLPKDEPFILLAESFSGPIALALAADPPPQLKALILVLHLRKVTCSAVGIDVISEVRGPSASLACSDVSDR